MPITLKKPAVTTEFDARYGLLNASQKKAVDAIEGPVMVIAGPGTGKTTVLTLRIANILRITDTPPSGILAITYTDAGVKAMRDKLRSIIGNRAHEVAIHTFHSFASVMIAEYPDHFLHLDGLKLMTDVEQECAIRSIIESPEFRELRPAGKPDAYISGIIRTIDDAKREALTPDMVKEHASKEVEHIKNDENSISTRGKTKGQLKADALEAIEKCKRTALFADVYKLYEDEKRKAKRMDFNDLIIELLVALRNDQLFLRLIQERFLYLLVDEHQDTNDAQNFIIALIAEFFETPNIFIVGDEKQAIYRFQGASVENFLLLQKRWPAMQVISLDTNYRSHQGLLDAAFSLIENNYEGDEFRDLRVELLSGSSIERRPLDVVTGENTAAIETYLIEELRSVAAKDPGASVAIITRRNRDVERVIRLLESAHIPVSSERSVDIFHHPVGAVFFDLIEYLADPSQTSALGRTLAAGLWGLSFEDSAVLIKALRSGKTADLDKTIPALLHLQREMLNDAPVGFVIKVAEESGLASLVSRDPAYVHVWRGIAALAESLTREGKIQSPVELLKAMLAYRTSAESKTVKVSVGAPDLPIKAMTAHGSKGLEFDYVFMPYATEESWVGRPRGQSFVLPKRRAGDHDIRDARRLFYVALTRARRHACILSALEESDGKQVSPLRFIAELGSGHVSNIFLPRISAELPVSKKETKGTDEFGAKVAALAKETLMESGLSVTALNHFLECPNKYLYESVLKLPQAPSASAEKGTAMHEAISKIWKESSRTADRIKTIMEESVVEYLNNSFLTVNEREAVKKDILEDIPAVAAALESHFNMLGPIFTEHWIKTHFEGSYNGSEMRIPVHGKLDAIVESGSDVFVYDYKTRQAMSVAEIKGETESSKQRANGAYFRQLVFYKILLSGEARWKNRVISPALVFVTPDKKGRCPTVSIPIQPEDMAALKNQIQSLIESVWSGKIASGSCDDRDCRWCALRQATGF